MVIVWMFKDDWFQCGNERFEHETQGVLTEQLQQELGAIARIGLGVKKPHGKAMGILSTALYVIEAEQGPAGLGHRGINPQRLAPGPFGEWVSTECGIGFALIQTHNRQLALVPSEYFPQVVKRQFRFLVCPGESDLGHEHMRLAAFWLCHELIQKASFGLIEFLLTEQSVQPSKARSGAQSRPDNLHRRGQKRDGEQEKSDLQRPDATQGH
jgi:hypothetical protein